MAVNVEGDGNAAVPEHGLHHLGGDPLLEEPGRKGVAGIVQPDRRQASLSEGLAESAIQGARVDGAPVRMTKHQAVIGIALAEGQPFLRLVGPVLAEGGQTPFGQRQRPKGALRLGFLKDQMRVPGRMILHTRQRLSDGQDARSPVDILPAEPQDLPTLSSPCLRPFSR